MPAADAAKLHMQHFHSTGKMPQAISKLAAAMYAEEVERDARRRNIVDHHSFNDELHFLLCNKYYSEIKAEIKEELLAQEGSESTSDGSYFL